MKIFTWSMLIVLSSFCFAQPQGFRKPSDQDTTLWQPYYITPRNGDAHMDLSGKWDLTALDAAINNVSEISDYQYRVTVPNSVHWALFEAGELPHPYHHQNVEKYNWIDEKVWYYRKVFDAPAAAKDNLVFLVFDGIDYYARVWLNGEYLGYHEGMFGGPAVEVKELLKTSQSNELVVEVKACNYGVKDTWAPRKNKGRVIRPWVFGYAKRFNPMGIWQNVRLEMVPKNHIERPFMHTEQLDMDHAKLRLECEVFAGEHSLNYQLNPWENKIIHNIRNERKSVQLNDVLSLEIEMIDNTTGQVALQKKWSLDIYTGRNWVQKTVELAQPSIWWPNGMGKANTYNVQLTLLKDGKALDEIQFTYGVRDIEQLPSAGPKTLDRWVDWQFKINGKKLFVKGINWMPADILYHLPLEGYQWWLDMAKNAGIQLIRVWGGGLLEPDYFYHCCNERGIMVWQDFPMGNANHDSWPQDVWQATAAMNIYRLRNHPSLAIYCGGNEFNPYSLGNSTMMGILEGLITDLDGSRLFMRSTPDRGSEHTYPDMDPTWYQYEYSLVPYMAETGIHNFADAKTIREEVSADELNKPITGIFKESFKDRYPEFFYHFTEYSPSRIPRMLSRASQIVDISEPMVEDLTQASQVGAGEFYQIFSEILQANYPVTTGLMPWVFKRPWTLVAIQTVDATGQPTAPYYFLKRTYEPTHVMVQLSHLMWAKNESIPITAKILHEEHYPLYNLQVHVSIYDKKFAPVKTFKENVDVNTGPSVTTLQLGEFGIPSYFEESFFYIMAELKDQNNKRLSRSVYWPRCLERMNDQQYRQEYRSEPQPALTFDKGPWLKDQVAETSTELELELISTEKRQKDRRRVNVRVRNQGKSPAWPVRFDIDGIKRSFYANDNYFWLAPGEEKEIEINVLLREPETGKSMSVTVETWNADKVVKSIE